MNVSLFSQAKLLILASIKAKLLMLTTLKIPLKILSKVDYPFSFSSSNENFNSEEKMTTTVFLFYQTSSTTLASKKEVWQRLISLKPTLWLSLKLNYPFLSPLFESSQITPVIKTMPKKVTNNITKELLTNKLSFGFGFGFFTYSFSKSPKYVKTKTKRIPNPLLISLSSSYLNLPILNMISHGGNR